MFPKSNLVTLLALPLLSYSHYPNLFPILLYLPMGRLLQCTPPCADHTSVAHSSQVTTASNPLLLLYILVLLPRDLSKTLVIKMQCILLGVICPCLHLIYFHFFRLNLFSDLFSQIDKFSPNSQTLNHHPTYWP